MSPQPKHRINFDIEWDKYKAIKDRCEGGRTVAHYIRKLIDEDFEKNLVVDKTPTGIIYGEPAADQCSSKHNQESLDRYLEKDRCGITYWNEFFTRIDDGEKARRYIALGRTVIEAAE
jgi:hypothetical protein